MLLDPIIDILNKILETLADADKAIMNKILSTYSREKEHPLDTINVILELLIAAEHLPEAQPLDGIIIILQGLIDAKERFEFESKSPDIPTTPKLSPFNSDNVRKAFEIEINLKTEADLKIKEKELIQIIKGFTKAEQKEYLTKYKELFTEIYSHVDNDARLNRMKELSELSLREPINLTKPIRFIEYIVLASLTEPFDAQYKDTDILDKYIEEFVNKSSLEPTNIKPKRKKGKN